MKETRIKKVFEILSAKNDYFTGDYLAERLKISSKSIRNDIKKLNAIIQPYGAVVLSRPRYGYYFRIDNRSLFDEFLTTKWHQYAFEEDFNSLDFRL